jgi:hypothetical protein
MTETQPKAAKPNRVALFGKIATEAEARAVAANRAS